MFITHMMYCKTPGKTNINCRKYVAVPTVTYWWTSSDARVIKGTWLSTRDGDRTTAWSTVVGWDGDSWNHVYNWIGLNVCFVIAGDPLYQRPMTIAGLYVSSSSIARTEMSPSISWAWAKIGYNAPSPPTWDSGTLILQYGGNGAAQYSDSVIRTNINNITLWLNGEQYLGISPEMVTHAVYELEIYAVL